MPEISYNFFNESLVQFHHVLIGGLIWVYAFQFNKAINEFIDKGEMPWIYFVTGFCLMFLAALLIVMQKNESDLNYNYKKNLLNYILGTNIFKKKYELKED